MNTSKKTEELSGENLQIMRRIINRIHVGTSKLDVIRQVWKKSGKLVRNAPKELRRGFIQAAIDIHCSNRKTYALVMKRIIWND